MPTFAKQRDRNEADIVRALVAAGASVTRVGDFGVPDLLVGYNGRTFLIEVKNPEAKGGGKYNTGGRGALTKAQVKWWDGWKGESAHLVETIDQALAAIGAA